MTPTRALCVLAAAALALSPVGACAAREAPTRRVLSNGLVVLVQERYAAPVVAVSLQVRAGSRDETEATAGLTNLLHRTMLRGTVRRSAGELARAAEELGGRLEAAGEIDAAGVAGSALATHWETLLELVAEVALEPALAPTEVERERRLVLAQLRSRGERPFTAALDALLADLFGSHPYAWPGLGRAESVTRLARDALLAHHRAIYRPERMALAVSGQVPTERVVRTAERLFGRLPGGRRGAPEPARPEATPTGARRVLVRPAAQAQVLVGALGPGLLQDDFAAWRVLGAALGGGTGSRLFAEVRERRGLAYAVGALTPFRLDRGLLVVHAGTGAATAAATEATMLRDIERVRTDGLGAEELGRAKAYLLGRLALDRRTSARDAWYLAFFEVVGAGWDFPERHARHVAGVSARAVTAAAGRYLARPTVVVLEPRG